MLASPSQLGLPFPWFRQLVAIVRLEARRNVFAARGIWLLLLAFAPAIVASLHVAFDRVLGGRCSIQQDAQLIAWLLLVFQLRVVVYFGMLGLFVQSFRGEMVNKALFYSLIAPLRREVLVAGKFCAAWLGGATFFVAGVVSCIGLLVLHHGSEGWQYLMRGEGLDQLGAYLGITLLACLGYGAAFLVLGHVFRNPVLAAVAFFVWEAVSALLPRPLQFLSVTFYLKPLFPVELPAVGISGLLTAVVEPLPPAWAVFDLMLVSAVAVTAVAVAFRRVEMDVAD